jgi:Uma2 family endonuclease
MVSRTTDAPVPLGQYVPTADSVVLMGGMSWEAYESLLAFRGERSRPRLAFLDGVVELMSPSNDHGAIKSVLARLIETYCSERSIAWSAYAEWTQKRKAKRAGLEPDECYIFGDKPKQKRKPDLAIEVVWTSGGIDKLEIYRRIGIAEVWYWIEDEITIYLLGPDGYVAGKESRFVPGIDLELLARHIAIEPMSRAVEQFRAILRRG